MTSDDDMRTYVNRIYVPVKVVTNLRSYEQMQIPESGNNSHETLIRRSSQIFRIPDDPNISLLQNEIADLRRQLLEANETIADLSDINTNIAGLTTNG